MELLDDRAYLEPTVGGAKVALQCYFCDADIYEGDDYYVLNGFDCCEEWGVPEEEIYDIIRDMKCERCKNENNQIKAGRTKAGSQKYKCKHCGKVYTPNPKGRNYSEEVKKQAIKLYMEGNSGRAVGRILGISKNICLYWIKKYAKKKYSPKIEQTNE